MPADFDRTDIAACAEAAVEVLPPAFRHANCVAVATGSHALKPGIRIRLWFWLSRPMGGAELKAWLHDAPVDDSLFSPAQPCYTASPTFDYPRIDHLPHRLVELPGEEYVHPPSPEELAPPEPRQGDIIRLDRQTSETSDRYVTGALDLAVLNVLTAPTGRRHRTIVREACCLARYIATGHLTAGEVRAVLTEAARRNGKADDAELQAAIDWGLGNPNARAIPVEDLRRAS